MPKKIAVKKTTLNRAATKKAKRAVTPTMREMVLQEIKASGKPVVAIAKEAGVAQPVLSRFVSGERQGFSLKNFEKICAVLGLKLVKDPAR